MKKENLDIRFHEKNEYSMIELVQSFKLPVILISCMSKGLFTYLNTPIRKIELMKSVSENDFSLLESLIAYNIIIEKGDILQINPHYLEFFIEGSDNYIGDFIIWQAFQVKNYVKLIPENFFNFNRSVWIKALDQMTSSSSMPESFISLCNDLNVRKIIDFGGGSGLYSKKFVESFLDSKSFLVETASMIKYTESFLSDYHKERIFLLESNSENIEKLPCCDLAFLSNFIHGKDRKFIKEIIESLSHKVKYFMFNNPLVYFDGRYQKEGCLMNVTMKSNNGIGNYSLDDISEIMAEFGFFLHEKKIVTSGGSIMFIYSRDAS